MPEAECSTLNTMDGNNDLSRTAWRYCSAIIAPLVLPFIAAAGYGILFDHQEGEPFSQTVFMFMALTPIWLTGIIVGIRFALKKDSVRRWILLSDLALLLATIIGSIIIF
jgi:hypothetical protein